MILGTRSAAFSVGFADRQGFLGSLEAAAHKTGLGLQAPSEDRLLLMTKAPKWLWSLMGRRHVSVRRCERIGREQPRQAKPPAPPAGTMELHRWRRRFRLRLLIFSHLLTLQRLADRNEALITGPVLPVRRIQKEFPNAVNMLSPGSLGFPWRGLLPSHCMGHIYGPAGAGVGSNGLRFLCRIRGFGCLQLLFPQSRLFRLAQDVGTTGPSTLRLVAA